MKLTKTNWVATDDKVSLAMPFSKVDKENRLVSGYATLDNEDSQDDVVVAEASHKAFTRFRGNLREMHQPIAAGRLVDFKEDEFYDTITEKFYRGIYVTAYVSKGAQDTWEKVLDGTLTGFSVGGAIKDFETEFVKDANGGDGKSIRFVKDYDLTELSLVDNPANQLANIFSITKSAQGSVIEGMVAETTVVNVFFCKEDQIVKNTKDESATCRQCGLVMDNIGWFEKGDNEAAQIQETVVKFLREKEEEHASLLKQTNTATIEGGVKMADENENDEVVVTEEVAPVVEDEATPVDEVQTTEPDFEKMLTDLKDTFKQSITEAVADVQSKVTTSFEEKTGEFEKALKELGDRLDGIKTERASVEKRLEALESSTAIKKSVSVEDDDDTGDKTLQKTSFWGSTFWE